MRVQARMAASADEKNIDEKPKDHRDAKSQLDPHARERANH
jgi:hypothetical protein